MSKKASGYRLGRAREHSLRYKLIREGWFCIRCQGSAGGLPRSEVKPIDLIAIKKGVVYFIQVSKRLNTISEEECYELKSLAKRYGAKPMIAYKDGKRWVMKEL
ncbi:MAG: hypothetical protein N3F06_03465 [Nitrososphaerales archaeon]|nr:hypothetical protein [Nitrososphaerales archaeon]